MTDEIEYHAARILLLLAAFAPKGGAMEGITKLVKLDFLLRYPQFLDRLVQRRGLVWPNGLQPTLAETLAVESPMIRYKYGPWDDRYYPILGYLAGTSLADITKAGGTLTIRLTPEGRAMAAQLAGDPSWQKVSRRAKFLRTNFNDSGSNLKAMIYREFPEVAGRRWRETI